jgi:3'-phosphoadenosine 5'-phosphosulfate sulfotransferase (PAPS reductase)/FAD synthetase
MTLAIAGPLEAFPIRKTYSRILVPVSGGKDSQVCLALAVDRFGADRVLGVHQRTNFDHSLTYAHMKYMEERYGVKIIDIHSEQYEDVPDVMLQNSMLPSRQARLCTRQLKTGPWFRWLARQEDKDHLLVYLGMRAAESNDRRKNYGHLENNDLYEMGDVSGECPKSCAKVSVQLPIVSMSTSAIFEFARKRGDKLNPLYKMGHKRVGCFPCVLAGPRSMKMTARDPEGRANLALLGEIVQVVKWARPDQDLSQFWPHDVDAILSGKDDLDPFGWRDQQEDNAGGCSWCNL